MLAINPPESVKVIWMEAVAGAVPVQVRLMERLFPLTVLLVLTQVPAEMV